MARYIMMRKIMAIPLMGLIYFYRYVISPLTPAACRHLPTCSAYSIDAVRIHGPFKGSVLAANRILRCHPWGTHGFDPVPFILFKKASLKKYGVSHPWRLSRCNKLKEHS